MQLSPRQSPSSRALRTQLFIGLLAAGTLVRCDCEEPQEFIPGATYEPDSVLDFGAVSVTSERTLDVKVISNGGAALVLEQLSFSGVDDATLSKFLFEGQVCTTGATCNSLKDDLLSGLSPGRTSSITITYRPCPDAWNGDVLKDGYDFASCPSAPDQVEMNIIDNSREGSHKIILTGQPAQAPLMEVRCLPSGAPGSQCNQDDAPSAMMTECVVLNFGNVTAGDPPCDIIVEVKNKQRQGKVPGTLNIAKMDVLVKEINDGTIVPGPQAGFSLRTLTGAPLVVEQTTPFQVPFPPGATEGVQRFKVRFDGTGYGIWRGERAQMTGLRVYSDDPDAQPFETVSVTGVGSAPRIQCSPTRYDFGPVEQNTTRTATINCSNAGDSVLSISDLRFETDASMSEFTLRTDRGENFPIEIMPFANNRIAIYVSYTPRNTGFDADALLIGSNDTNNNPLRIGLSGGATPRIECQPGDTLVFALPNPRPPPPLPRQCLPLRCSNVGFGDLIIQRLTLIGPNGAPDHSAVDDFSIRECPMGFPCTPTPEITLCPPSNPACTNSTKELEICYQNNDNSTIDLADLKIDSTDPGNPTLTITLQAEDVPCLFPTPIITVETPQPTEGMEVCVNAMSSDPGGDPGMPASITDYEWSWQFFQGAPPVFNPATGPRVCFTPSRAGVHILNLHVTNNCGRRSQAAGDETIVVRAPT